MSKRTAAGLAALLVWGVNKALTFAGMAHLAPSWVWILTFLMMGAAAHVSESPVTEGNKTLQRLLAILALLGSIGVQLVDTQAIPKALEVTIPAGAIELAPPTVVRPSGTEEIRSEDTAQELD